MTRAIAGFQDQCLKPLGHTSRLGSDFTISAKHGGFLPFPTVADGPAARKMQFPQKF
jgi:hypothetical protein